MEESVENHVENSVYAGDFGEKEQHPIRAALSCPRVRESKQTLKAVSPVPDY
jgi:hypothetical protein